MIPNPPSSNPDHFGAAEPSDAISSAPGRRPSRRANLTGISIAGLALLFTACGSGSIDFSIGGQSPEAAAEELIETELADELGLELDAECEDLEDPEVGSTFNCTGTTTDDQVAEFSAEIDREDHIDVNTTNVVSPDGMLLIEQSAGEALGEQVGVAVTIDCGGATTVILDEEATLDCTADDGTNQRDAVVIITDPATGQFRVELV